MPRDARHLVPLVLALCSCIGCSQPPSPRTSAAPAFVDSSSVFRPVHGTPQGDPGRWALAFVDVETTGLVPGWHEMIDLGLVMTDLDGVSLDSLFLRIQPEHPERLDPGAQAVNAYDHARWQELGAIPTALAADSIVRFVRRTAAGRSVMMVAFNSPFDNAFVDHLFRASGRSWREIFHYYVLDLPSMAWVLGDRSLDGPSLSADFGVPDEPHVAEEHTGITGAALNARLYRAMRARAGRPSRP